jgi:hypothetical protein
MDFGRRNPFQEGPVQERPPWSPIELFLDENNKITMPNIKAQVLDYSQPMIWAAAGMILFNPIFWNFVARNGKSPYRSNLEHQLIIHDCLIRV